MIPPLKDFVEALSVSWPIALAALLGSSALLLAADHGFLLAVLIPDWLQTVLFVVAAFSAAVLIAGLSKAGLDTFRIWRAKRARKAKLISNLYDLSVDEREVMASQLARNERAFTARLIEERLAPLMARGLIIRHAGQYSILDWPFEIHPDVWAEMKAHPELFQ